MPTHPPASHDVTRQATRLALAIVGLDQLTKLAATHAAAGHPSGLLVPLRNPRFSLGVAGAPPPVMNLLMATGILLAGSYALAAARHGRLPAWIPGLLAGGGASNLLDRLLLGSVRDFLAVGWVVVNLADLAVLAAVAGYLAYHSRPPTPTPTRSRGEVHP